ncbi:MAG: hypothetical protein UR31_C0017G0010 [Parcubacteria group bacterium GW2011_GWA2_33_14]|uniref:Uncharacterized protein n=1 Tax=Candidatus Staskawiczbacteria bacterium RIFCSPHIGHO2_02_FULL_33_16 TaxID=1802204 RepID=A0A1G2HY65_9BACT|nr:MAG: hypothetical protein UR31_C0017G0010 [Parcubacteria group bacterium GW2011_GWA2_33_14]OGZ67435.1 MAG: hypothetical protein A3D34_02225 [Candidatus Staskawiczbacteria bacterium RIFCSPHIGHO2_02_FULL_33_16]OGZ70968.1 MAG: hypothetical protein A2980_03100 [Candidatus Staskawiczbacteria bacterium RIFCSPLOWO2_01_FULL_33_13]
MAIVFISPKKRQRMFLLLITALLILSLIIMSFVTFFPEIKNKFQNVSTEGISQIPDVKINFSIIDSPAVENLELFQELQIEFSYIAQDENDNQVIGKIISSSKDGAKKTLEERGLKVSVLEEANLGRNNPFVSY